jgi:PAS domain S-box-containing protein
LGAAEQAGTGVFRLAPEAMFFVDNAATIVEVNEAAERFFGMPASDVIGKNMADFGAPGYDPGPSMETFLSEGSRRGEYRLVLAGGAIRDVEYSATAHVAPGLHLATVRDITERKRLEASLRSSEDLFARTLLNAPAAITVSSVETSKFVLVNEAFLRFTGYWRSEVIGRSAADLQLWAEPAQREAVSKQLGRGPLVDSFRATFRAKSGELLYGLCSAQLTEIGGQACVITAAIEDVPPGA